MKKNLIVFLSLINLIAFSQTPSNNSCSTAIPIIIPSSGNICINSSNAGATGDGSINACQTGDNEVWFSYVVNGTTNIITATPTATTPVAKKIVITTSALPCSGTTYTFCNASTTNGGTATINSTTFLTGTTILIAVSTNGTAGNFQLCITSSTPPAPPGKTCSTAAVICDRTDFTVSPMPAGQSGFKPSCFGAPPQRDIWYKFTVGLSGTFNMAITPLAGDEYDFAMYDITTACVGDQPTGTAVACNYNLRQFSF